MLKPVGKVIEQRRRRIQDNLDAATNCTQEAEKVLNNYQTSLHASRSEAQSIIQEALGKAQKERDEQLKAIQSEGRDKLDKLKAELTACRESLLQSLIHSELELVGDIINKLLGERPALVTNEERVFQVLKQTR